MSNNHVQRGVGGFRGGLCGGKCRETINDGVYANNPIIYQVLGICSALAVTNRVEKSLVMGGALIFVLSLSGFIVSLIRSAIPRRIRMITEVAIIATSVIIFDQFLKAFYWDMSKQLGPYVALIITNCIVMGRAEAYATQNPPFLSLLDGMANGLGYALILFIIAVVRELWGAGTLFGFEIFAQTQIRPNFIFVLAPGAFFTLGFIIWIINAVSMKREREE